MSRPLRAARYAVGASPTLVRLITGWLPYTSFEEAHQFYAETIPQLSPTELALLGCNDRYFLLTGLCNRVDMIHPWRFERCREVEVNPDGYIDLWFREAGKSSVITFAGSIQELLVNPEITIGIFSNTRDISRPFLAQIKQELETNEALMALYPDVLWRSPNERRAANASWSVEDGITVKRSGNPKECTIEAHGLIDAMPTGRHFDLQVFNDVINEKNVTSPEQIRKSIERLELADNLGKAENSRKWIEGTRYSYADGYGIMIENKVAQPRIYPATEDGTINGAPVLFSAEAWETKKRNQRSQIAAQMLQNPLAGKENTFRTSALRPYWVLPVMQNVYILGDPSRGRNKTSDRTALAVIGIDAQHNKYLLDGYCHRMPLSERWDKLQGLHRKWSGTPGVQLVRVGYERYGMQSDDEYFEEKMRRQPEGRFAIEEINWTGERGRQSKAYRVERLEPDFRQSRFFVPAKVWHPAVAVPSSDDSTGTDGLMARAMDGTALWEVKEGSDDIIYKPYRGPHRYERAARASGELWRLMEPLRRLDEDGNIYDLVRVFFEEYSFFPFSPRDDLIDAVSRIYDMDPMPAVRREQVVIPDYPDA